MKWGKKIARHRDGSEKSTTSTPGSRARQLDRTASNNSLRCFELNNTHCLYMYIVLCITWAVLQLAVVEGQSNSSCPTNTNFCSAFPHDSWYHTCSPVPDFLKLLTLSCLVNRKPRFYPGFSSNLSACEVCSGLGACTLVNTVPVCTCRQPTQGYAQTATLPPLVVRCDTVSWLDFGSPRQIFGTCQYDWRSRVKLGWQRLCARPSLR